MFTHHPQTRNFSYGSKLRFSFYATLKLRKRHPPQLDKRTYPYPLAGLLKTGIRGIQDTRQIVDGKTNDIENNDKKGGYKLLT